MNEGFSLAPGPVTASLVVDEFGRAISNSGSSKGLGNQTDLALLKWFRARSQVVLTSGKTAEAENYRLPSQARLAIFSRTERTYVSLADTKSQVIFLNNLGSYAQALDALHTAGYQKIHCEFGPSGFIELLCHGRVDGFVSSTETAGVERFAQANHLSLQPVQLVGGDLFVAQLLGRG